MLQQYDLNSSNNCDWTIIRNDAPRFIDYSNDPDAKSEMERNFERWQVDKNIYELITDPRIFTGFCLQHSMMYLHGAITDHHKKLCRSFEILRCAIAGDILTQRKAFTLYMVPVAKKNCYSNGKFCLKKELTPLSQSDLAMKIQCIQTIVILKEVCDIAGINVNLAFQRNEALNASEDITAFHFERKKDNQLIALRKQIFNDPEQFAKFMNGICAPKIPEHSEAKKQIEDLRTFLLANALSDRNFKISAVPNGAGWTVLRSSSRDSSFTNFDGNPKCCFLKDMSIEQIMNKICELTGKNLASKTYNSGLTVYNLMSNTDPYFKSFKLTHDVYQSYSMYANTYPQNLYQDYLEGNYCDLVVTTREGKDIPMHSNVYKRWGPKSSSEARNVKFHDLFIVVEPFINWLYLGDKNPAKYEQKYVKDGKISIPILDCLKFARKIKIKAFEDACLDMIAKYPLHNVDVAGALKAIDETLYPDLLRRQSKFHSVKSI